MKKVRNSRLVVLVLMLCIQSFLLLSLYSETTSVASSTETRTFTEITDAFENPFMGWVKRDYHYKTADAVGKYLVSTGITWRELEPTKGTFNFAAVESQMHYTEWIAKGYKFIIGFNMDCPDKDGIDGDLDIPDYIYNAIGKENGGTRYQLSSGSKGFSPNYSNPVLIAEHDRVIAELAKRYDNVNTYSIAIGSLGHWGEMHTYFVTNPEAVGAYPHTAVEAKYLEPYGKYFKNVYLASRMPREVLIKYNVTLNNYGFADKKQTYDWFLAYVQNGYTDYYTKDYRPAYPDYWKKGPHGGECYEWPHLKYFMNDTIDDTINQAKQSHMTWLFPPPPHSEQPSYSNAVYAEVNANMNKFLKVIGYRLVLNQIEYTKDLYPDTPLYINMNWSNTGVAPCYFNWPMEIGLQDSSKNIIYKSLQDANLKTWLPGIKNLNFSLNLPTTIPEGVYNLTVAIINPVTGLPGVKLAFNATNNSDRYVVGQLNVKKESIPQVSSIVINGQSEITIGNTAQYSAVVNDQNGNSMPAETVSWSLASSYNGASIDNTGKLTIAPTASAGSLTIKAVSNSNINIYSIFLLTIKPQPSLVSSINISGQTSIIIGNTAQYSAVIKDQNGNSMPSETVSWSLLSSYNGASIDNTGKLTITLTAFAGTLTIKAVSNSNINISSICNITVIKIPSIPVSSVSLSQTNANLPINNTLQLTATVLPANATNKTVSYLSNAPLIASVDNTGKVTALKVGNAVITVITNDGNKTATCNITVPQPLINLALNRTATASSIENSTYVAKNVCDGNTVTRWSSAFNSSTQWVYIDLGSSYSVSRVVLRWEAAYAKSFKIQVSNDAISWTDVYSTTNGVVSYLSDISFNAVSSRYVRMYATEKATKWYYSLWEFEIYGKSITVSSVSLSQTSANLPINNTLQLTATVLPANATNKTVTYLSSAPLIASVDNAGKVTALKTGNAVITVTTNDGKKTAMCNITVPEQPMNLALNKTATASSIENSSYVAKNACDGNTVTRWSSAFNSRTQWIYIDLGSSYAVRRVVLRWEAAYAKSFKIQVSNDAISWKDVYSTTNGVVSYLSDISFNAVSSRYVRMYATEKATKWYYSLWEFEIYS